MSQTTLSPILGKNFREALDFAFTLHMTQIRKGTEIPYFTHLMTVSALVLENGGDEDTAIAALLHDGVEDQGGKALLKKIRDRFGVRVADLVEECSDSQSYPKPPWKQRKQKYLAHIGSASAEARLISSSDKLHNLRSILDDYRAVGDSLWDRFKGTEQEIIWYYTSFIEEMKQSASTAELPILDKLKGTLNRLNSLISLKDHDRKH